MKKKPRKNYQTQWSGQFGAAHELSRRGYLVTFTTGNAPVADLLCESRGGRLFSVQVKSLSSRTGYIFQKPLLEPRDNLFFILVLLPSSLFDRPEYFILNHEEARRAIAEQNRVNKETEKRLRRPLKPFSAGINYSVLAKNFDFRDAWKTLPQ